MAHKPLVNGAVSEVGGGKPLVNGTAYSIDKGKTLVNGTAFEVGFGGKPCTVKIRSQILGAQEAFEKVYVTIDGQQYKPNTITQGNGVYSDIATLTVPAGTVVHCSFNLGIGPMPPTVNVGDVAIATGESGLLEYDYVVNGSVIVDIIVRMMGYTMGLINITEIPETYYDIIVNSVDYGVLTVNKTSAVEYDTITITPNANDGYEYFGAVALYTIEGDVLGTQIAFDTSTFSFTMPAASVTITPIFGKPRTVTLINSIDDSSSYHPEVSYSVKLAVFPTAYYTEDATFVVMDGSYIECRINNVNILDEYGIYLNGNLVESDSGRNFYLALTVTSDLIIETTGYSEWSADSGFYDSRYMHITEIN